MVGVGFVVVVVEVHGGLLNLGNEPSQFLGLQRMSVYSST